MVLLTSSAISVAISSSVVCIFTFLLFLSGYVLQQQTLRSLQAALRNPPEKPHFPEPTLPPQFQDQNGTPIFIGNIDQEPVTDVSGTQQVILAGDDAQAGINIPIQAIINTDIPEESTPQQLWHDYIRQSIKEGSEHAAELPIPAQPQALIPSQDLLVTQDKLAYFFTVPHTSDLCAAALFAKWHRSQTHLATPPSIVLMYPATWETTETPAHNAALDLLREMQDNYNVICHPVGISRIWAGIEVESQLLAELQRTRWAYDRAIYLRLPGIVLDISTLDKALALSHVKDSWQPLSTKSTSKTPPLLLYRDGKGLLAPKADMIKLTAQASTSHANHHADEMAVEVMSKHAAYVMFDEKELEHRRLERVSYGSLFERFERDRRAVCAGTGLLDGGTNKVRMGSR